MYLCIFHLIYKAHQLFCDLSFISLKLCDGWKMYNKRSIVIWDNQSKTHRNKEFWEERLFLRNLTWNTDGQLGETNDPKVKITFIVESTYTICNYIDKAEIFFYIFSTFQDPTPWCRRQFVLNMHKAFYFCQAWIIYL